MSKKLTKKQRKQVDKIIARAIKEKVYDGLCFVVPKDTDPDEVLDIPNLEVTRRIARNEIRKWWNDGIPAEDAQ